jgi:peptide/nickel transport system substrate-binding protein
MKRKTTALAASAVLGIGALLLAGCAPLNPKASATATAAPELPVVGWKTVQYSDLAQGGTLNLAALQSGTDGGNWNLNTAEGNEQDVINILAPLQGAPLKATPTGGVVADPNYATSVKLVSTSPEIAEVKLNPKAVFEDGSPITAADYKATFATMSGADTKFDVVSTQGFDDVSAFDVVSDTDFKVTFKTTYADWQALFTLAPVQASIASDSKAWNKGYVTKPMPSVGPYIMSKVDNSASTYTETPNPKWWGTKPKLDTITWKVIDQTAQGQAFANGEINAVDASDVDTYVAATKKAGSVKETSGGLSWSQVTFNGTAKPLDNVNVRKAVAMAINRDIISKAANAPLGVATTTDGNYIFMPGQKGYTDTVSASLGYSASNAKKLLKKAGYTLSGGKWTKDGAQLKLSIIFPQGTASNQLRAQQIQASLKAIDIPVELQQVPSANYFNNIIAGKFEMTTFGWGGTLFPISAAESLFSPAQKPGDENGQNYSFITDPKLKTLFDSANSDLNPTHRLATAKEINKVIAAYAPMLPIAPYPNVTVIDKDVANYGPSTFSVTDWTQVGFTK